MWPLTDESPRVLMNKKWGVVGRGPSSGTARADGGDRHPLRPPPSPTRASVAELLIKSVGLLGSGPWNSGCGCCALDFISSGRPVLLVQT